MLEHTIPILSTFRAYRTPDREAIFDFDKKLSYTYRDLDERSTRLAAFLTQKLGLQRGDRIGFLSNTTIAMFDSYYASCKTGLIITTYNGRLRVDELVTLIENESPSVIFFSDCFREKVSKIKLTSKINCIFICIENIYGAENRYCYDDICKYEPQNPLPQIAIDPEEPQMLVHTGGTTGIPKAAVLSFRCVFMNAISEILTWQLNWEDSAYIAMPMNHTGGWNLLSLPLLMMGGRIIITAEFSVENMLEITKTMRPTIFMGVETMFKSIANHPKFHDTPLDCYKWMTNGGAPISKEALDPYWKRGVKVLNGYGMTEIGPNNLTCNIDVSMEQVQRKVNTVGKPFLFAQCRLVDAEGKDVPQGMYGELIWKGEITFSGYWNNPEETAKMIDAEGWIHSGDIGYADEDGDIFICGRSKNMYISGGENIFPSEIEGIINQHPKVYESCVVGVKDSRWGEVGKAVIVTMPGNELTEEELREYFKNHLSTIKQPKYIAFVNEIPKNSAGKRNEKLIKAMYGA